jgi:hypothetical protein
MDMSSTRIRPKGISTGRIESGVKNLGERFLNSFRRRPLLFFVMLVFVSWKLTDGLDAAVDLVGNGQWGWPDLLSIIAAIFVTVVHQVEVVVWLPYNVRRTWAYLCRHAVNQLKHVRGLERRYSL